MHMVDINFVSFIAQICIHKITSEVGGRRPYRYATELN